MKVLLTSQSPIQAKKLVALQQMVKLWPSINSDCDGRTIQGKIIMWRCQVVGTVSHERRKDEMQHFLKIFWRHICSQVNQPIVRVEQLRPRTSAGLVVAERVPGEVFTPCQSWQTLGLWGIRWKRNKAAKPPKYVDVGGNDRKDNFQNDTKRKCEIVQWEVEWYLLSSDWLTWIMYLVLLSRLETLPLSTEFLTWLRQIGIGGEGAGANYRLDTSQPYCAAIRYGGRIIHYHYTMHNGAIANFIFWIYFIHSMQRAQGIIIVTAHWSLFSWYK